jgi:uncharacterized protein with von Willebrand factor type A (vWA) domain
MRPRPIDSGSAHGAEPSADDRRTRATFGVETIHLDLPALTAAFGRRLHEAGVPVTPERTAAFASALTLVRPVARRRLYWTARGIFVSDPAHVTAFDAVFRTVFGTGSDLAFEHPAATAPPDAPREQPMFAPPREADDGEEVEVPRAVSGDEERLANRSFDALEPGELAQLYRLMSRLELAPPPRRTRRYERARHGRRIDMRRTLRHSLRSGGEPLQLARRRRRVVRRRMVLLCDISGSMEPYARAYLQLLAAATASGPSVETFVFATRLTRLTRALRGRHPERAMQRAAATAPDWSSGTRIADALKAFNDRHGRRGMARGAVVVIVSDGWERGEPEKVGREMERLARLAHRIVWVNPRVSASAFTVRAGGMVAALPHCDALVSGHSFAALGQVVDAIAGVDVAAPDAAEEEPEPWASATPVPGSSVAMPSGYGPSRGRTTPGWSIGGR